MAGGRPVSRTARLEEDELVIYRTFGTSTNAYRQLRLSPLVSLAAFRRAWEGKEVAPKVVQAVRYGWENWATRMIQTVRERQKPPVSAMFTPGGSPVTPEVYP